MKIWAYCLMDNHVHFVAVPMKEDSLSKENKQSPYVVMEKQYYQLFRMFAKEFGLTPVGRIGLVVGAEADDDDDLLSK